MYVINKLELKIVQLHVFSIKRISRFFAILYSMEEFVCLEYCIFNANVNMQKLAYLSDNFIAIGPRNQKLHIQLLCNTIHEFGGENKLRK